MAQSTPPLSGRAILLGIPNLNVFGGTEAHTGQLVSLLHEAGVRVIVCCYFLSSEHVVAPLREAGAEIVLLSCSPGHPLSLMRKIREVVREHRPDLVHVQYIAPGLLPVIAARLAGARCVTATLHQTRQGRSLLPRVTLTAAKVLCTGLTCVSEAVAASWFSRVVAGGARGKVAVVHNGIALEPPAIGRQGRAETERLGRLCEGKRVVGVVGRLRKEKNQGFLIRAMARVIEEFPEAILLVIGTGPDRAKLESLCRDVGLERHVVWTGEIAPEVVAAAYDLMEVVAVPSLQESFGFVAAEAMAHNLPVVGLKVEGLKEVVENEETGILVEPGDQEAFAEAIIRLLKDKEAAARMGRKARQRVETKFGLPRFESGMMSFFSGALKRASRG